MSSDSLMVVDDGAKEAEAVDQVALVVVQPHPKSGFKSWRKKYRKLRIVFEEAMRESNELYTQHQRALITAKRLQEQNDQLLELLLDLNESDMAAPQDRIDVRSPSPTEMVVTRRGKDSEVNQVALHRALREARLDYESGNLSNKQYEKTERELLSKLSEPSVKSISNLMKVEHTRFSPNNIPEELLADPMLGYLSPDHEQEYVNSLDITLADGTEAYGSMNTLKSAITKRKPAVDKDPATENPHSVLNWLKRHNPQSLNLDRDLEIASEKSVSRSRKPGSKRATDSVRSGTPAASRDELDFEDDEIPYVAEPPSKIKRTRDDEAYRPKGSGSRSSKRKRDDGEKGPGKKKAKSSGVGTVVENDDLSLVE